RRRTRLGRGARASGRHHLSGPSDCHCRFRHTRKAGRKSRLQFTAQYFIVQSMKAMQWICVVAGAGFIGWTHAHTDEVPVVLGFILILSAILGGVFPRKPWLTGLIVGIAPFVVEALHNDGLI